LLGVIDGLLRRSRQRHLLAATRDEQQRLFEMIAGIETVKCEAAEGRMLTRWVERLLREERAALALHVQASTFAAVTASCERAVFAAVLLFLAQRCLATGASVGSLVAAVQATAGFMLCVQKLAQLPAAVSDYRSHADRADAILLEAPEPEDMPTIRSMNGPAVVVRDVWFRYEEGKPWVLAGVNLTVGHGEHRVLDTASGSGKTTLLRLVAGLEHPCRGDVLVGGIEASLARSAISYVPQHATLLPLSIRENLRVLSRNAPMDRILAAARATGLAAMLSESEMGFDTIVAAGAANISSGQRQLVLLTAVVASDAPVVLLDEALAHVDAARRAQLGRQLFAGRTVIMVSHDAV
jgi:ABC-type bacteriocin/lantibiotic exporter with double-glycine peptidase domain